MISREASSKIPPLTRWVPYDGYIRHQNDHAVWRIYPSWVNDKLRAWEGLGHSGMFWARLWRDDFRSKLENTSFLFRVMFISKSFSVSRAFVRFGAKRSSSGALVSTMPWSFCLKLLFVTGHFFANSEYDREHFFENFLYFFKAERVSLARQLWWSQGWAKHFRDDTSKTRMKTSLPSVGKIERRRIVDHRRDRHQSLAVIHCPKEKKSPWSQSVIVRSINPSSFTKPASFRSLDSENVAGARRPDVAIVLHFTVFLLTNSCRSVRLQRGGQRREAVIRDTSGNGHQSVTNLSASIWFTGQRHPYTVFRHEMQLSLLTLC